MISEIFALIGLSLITASAFFVSFPLGLLVAGSCCLAIAIGDKKRKPEPKK